MNNRELRRLVSLCVVLWLPMQLGRAGVNITTLYTFSGPDGLNPEGHLVEGPDGNLYGTTCSTSAPRGNQGWGMNGQGTVFKLTTHGALTTLVRFKGTNGTAPRSGLILGRDGNFYGTTVGGGTNNDRRLRFGTIFKVTPNGALTTLADFHNSDGALPWAELVEYENGSFLGVTPYGGLRREGAPESLPPGTSDIDSGVIFKLPANHALIPIVLFARTNGQTPFSRLVKQSGNVFYGTTSLGGAHGRGTAFRVTASGELKTLFDFGGTNGGSPNELILGDDGNLYGTTSQGGLRSHGTVFMLSTNGNLKTMVSFDGQNGEVPRGSLILAKDGNFYGTTTSTGQNNHCTVFQLSKCGILRRECSFTNSTMFGRGSMTLTQTKDGAIYCTSADGGGYGCGSISKITIDTGIPEGSVIAATEQFTASKYHLERWYAQKP